ncbi:MAG: hypothetical protein QG635_2203 [Bacteroidota bacterium]|nr:hypothetical protein [Bacteroidota bacterium]
MDTHLFFEILGHGANIIYVIGFMVRNILWLRILMVGGAITEIIYSYYYYNDPLWVNIFWCSIYILVNFIQLILIVRDKLNLKFTEEESRLFKLAFTPMNEILYKKLIGIADWVEADPGFVLVDEGVKIDRLLLIYSGIAEVENKGTVVAYLRDGNFVGEMSYITGNVTSAKVTALSHLKYVVWDKETLGSLITRNKDIDESLKSIFNIDLVKKLSKGKSHG